MKKLLRSLLVSVIGTTAAYAADKPNVLLICVDDLKPLLSCYGSPIIKTPNIDRLAARGVLFERAFCNQAVCAPSRNSLMTGMRPSRLGIYDLATNFRKSVPDAVTLAQYFQQHGYRTEAMGKIMHVGHGNFEDEASWSVPHWKPKGGGYQLKESTAVTRPSNVGGPRGAATECADVPDNAYGDGMIADEAILRLRAAKEKSGQPFFMGVGFLKPHLPFTAPKKYWDLYQRSQFTLPKLQTPPEGAPKYAPTTWGELRQYSDIPELGPLTTEQKLQLIHGYHAATSFMDAQLGHVLDALDENGFGKNTIIVLWGDHGWHLGDHGMWCKHTNYEHAARIPLIVSVPGAKAGVKTASLAETVDIYPTLCELAGLPAPQGLDGASFAAVLRDPSAKTKEAVFHVYPRESRMGRAIRTAQYRLVEWKKTGDPAESADLELYDYFNDPEETKNLASENPEVVAKLRAILATQPEAKPQIRAPKKSESRASAPAKPKQDRNAMFDKRDKDHDGKLTREEFLEKQPDPAEAPKRFEKFDANHDGVLSREEFVSGGKVTQ